MLPLPFLPYEGGPTVIEWLNQICQKFNELLTAVKNVRELPPGGTHGQVATPKEDGSGYEWVNKSGGSDDLWYPTVTTAGIISWAKSSTTTPPASRNIKGPQGNDGTPGKDGTTPTFEVGTVTKLSPDADPTVTIEDVGGGLYMIDYGIPQGQPGTPGADSGDVVAAGNNVFTGTNHFEGLTVLGETHAETPTDDNDVTNKLYVDTLAGTTKTSAVTEADEHTDNKINALRTLPTGGTSGQVPTIANDGASIEWQTPSDVVAAGNNVFTGTNHFEGLTVLGETHAETPTDDNDVTNKLYVDTLAGTTKTSAVTEADEHTDNKINALRTLPTGGTSGQVPTIANDGASIEWQTPSGGGGGGGVEWVEVTLSLVNPSVVNIDNLKLWYDKNDHKHLKFEGYMLATDGEGFPLSLLMPDDFSPVATDIWAMWTPLLSAAGTDISHLSTTTLYVQFKSSYIRKQLDIFPVGPRASWSSNYRYSVGSEIYLNTSQLP